jgi:PqqD family protein of HPr-rel-A system
MTKFEIPGNVAVSDSGFLFMPTTGETFTMNEMGIFIFKMLQQKYTRNEIFEKALDEFDIDKTTFEKDFEDFIAQLKNYSLIKIS